MAVTYDNKIQQCQASQANGLAQKAGDEGWQLMGITADVGDRRDEAWVTMAFSRVRPAAVEGAK